MRAILVSAAVALLPSALASGGADAVWFFDLETSGEDVDWISTTPLAPAAGRYRFTYTITLAEAEVSLGGLPLGTFDILDQIPPEQLSDVGYAQGPAPVIVWNSSIVAPEPPEPTAVAADFLISVDASGFAHLEITNVTLGTATQDVGQPFGIVTVDIDSIRVAGEVSGDAITLTSDLNNDCQVDTADLGVLIGQFGTDAEQGDLNDDDVVDTADLGLLIQQFGFVCP